MSIDSLTGKVALVTGGSRGIGRAIAIALTRAGVDIAVNYRERGDDAVANRERSPRARSASGCFRRRCERCGFGHRVVCRGGTGARTGRHSGKQCGHCPAVGARVRHRAGLGRVDHRKPEILFPDDHGCIARHACASLGTIDLSIVGGGSNRWNRRTALCGIEGRACSA